MSAREFNQSIARAQRLADDEPVLVTRRGEPAYVLLSISEYDRLVSTTSPVDPRSFLEMIEPVAEGTDPDDEFGRIMDEIAAERSRDFGREIDL